MASPASQTRPADRPFVLSNMAVSADGKIATGNRAVNSFGSARDHRHLYELRATADAILCGARTVEVPNVTLDAGDPRFERERRRRGLRPQPLAVVVSGSGRVNPQSAVFRARGEPPIVLVCERATATAIRRLGAVAREVACFGKDRVDLAAALRWLYQAHGVRRVVAEGGAELNGALLEADLVDEWHVTLCPVLVGGRDAPTLAGGAGIPRLIDAVRLAAPRVRRVGQELFLVYRRTTTERTDLPHKG